jgi:hypothetical protein
MPTRPLNPDFASPRKVGLSIVRKRGPAARRKHQIVIGKISVLLFKLALQLVPRAFHLQLVHKILDVQKLLLFTSGFAKIARR